MTLFGSDDTLVAALAGWLPTTRWFPSKSQRLAAITIVDRIRLPLMQPAEFVVVDLTLTSTSLSDTSPNDTAASHRLAVPLCWQADGPVDAAASPEVVGWLTQAALTGAAAEGSHTRITGVPVSASVALSDTAFSSTDTPQVTPLTADSSNTVLHVCFGGASAEIGVVCKLLRQVRHGLPPDVEIGRFLAGDTEWRQTPPLLGFLQWHGPTGEPAVVAVVHAQVPAATSLWDELLTRLGGMSLAGDHSRGGESLRQEVMPVLIALGQTTADMHRALAAQRDDAAFGSEPWTADMQAAATHAMTTHAQQVFARLRRLKPPLPAATLTLLDEVCAHEAVCLARLASLNSQTWQSRRIRVHGDYHLGQVLFSRGRHDGLVLEQLQVIDFEGEPARSLAERREKHAAAKDVAGMLRSLDYLIRVAHRQAVVNLPADAYEQFAGWFLGSYTAAAHSSSFWPADPEEAGRMLAIYCLDKAIYEVAYEADNRPDWLDVPLTALLQIVATDP